MLAKRLLDSVLAGAALLVLAPALAFIAVLIRTKSGGPVLYVATRVGQGGTPFRLYKFRTMIVAQRADAPRITAKGDPRVTPLGRVLRRYKLDELPQLLNVVKGDMSLVGPRPEDPDWAARYTPAQQQVFLVKPGLTGVASLRFSNEEELLTDADWEDRYLREIVPMKTRLEIDYACTRSLLADLKVMAATAARLVSPGRAGSPLDGDVT